jgi:outer membrane protein assembly factor BamA
MFVFESRLRAGIVNEYDNTSDVPIFERFFAGGSNTVRGFRERRVGPIDPSTNDPIGGEAMLVGTLEEVLTIIKDERGRSILRGSAFLDIGNVWRRISDFGESYKSGAGVGVRVNTPIGPVRLDIGVPLSGLGDEKRSARMHFNVSRSF